MNTAGQSAYWNIIERTVKRLGTGDGCRFLGDGNGGCAGNGAGLAVYVYYGIEAGRSDVLATAARGLVNLAREDDVLDFFNLCWAAWAFGVLRGRKMPRFFSTAEQRCILDLWLRSCVELCVAGKGHPEYDNHNRTALAVAGAARCLPHLPPSRDRETIRKFVMRCFDNERIFPPREDASMYNAQWLFGIMDAADALGVPLAQVSTFKQLVESYAAMLTERGYYHWFGDDYLMSNALNYLAIFERYAAVYRDGRYRDLAARLFAWARRTGRLSFARGATPNLGYVFSLALAHRYADPRVKARRGIWSSQDIGTKIVLRSGRGRRELFALIQKTGCIGHGHADVHAILGLSKGDTILLCDTTYKEDLTFRHNTIGALPPAYRARRRIEAALRMAKLAFNSNETATGGMLGANGCWTTTHYSGPIEARFCEPYAQVLERRCDMLDENTLRVSDRICAYAPVTVLQLWHAQRILDQGTVSGARWFRTRYETISTPYYSHHDENPRGWDLVIILAPGREPCGAVDVSYGREHRFYFGKVMKKAYEHCRDPERHCIYQALRIRQLNEPFTMRALLVAVPSAVRSVAGVVRSGLRAVLI